MSRKNFQKSIRNQRGRDPKGTRFLSTPESPRRPRKAHQGQEQRLQAGEVESDPDLTHAKALIAAYTAFQEGKLTSNELYELVGEIRERKLARLQARQDPHHDCLACNPCACGKRGSEVPQVER